MTLEEVKALSDEELRIKVAELAGWEETTRVYSDDGRTRVFFWVNGDGESYTCTPDYPHDLNACHEMEKALEGFDKADYIRMLNLLTDSQFRTTTATARQRCEAFVLTMEDANKGS